MKTWKLFLVVLSAILLAREAFGQATIDDLCKKSELSRDERTRVESWVEDQAGAYQRAKREVDRKKVRDALLKYTKEGEATPAFLEVYGQVAASKMTAMVEADDRTLAHQSLLILSEIKAAGTREAYIAALSSKFAEVRYQGALSLSQLRSVLRKPDEYGPVLEALGQAGAGETEPLVLGPIYEAIDMLQGEARFEGRADVAKALIATLEGRLAGLSSRKKKDEKADLLGLLLVGKAGAALKGEAMQARLALVAARYMKYLVERYEQIGPDGGGATLAVVAEACESSLAAILQSAGGGASPPGEGSRVAKRMRDKADAKVVREALASWIGADGKPGVLNGEPWSVPAGLAE